MKIPYLLAFLTYLPASGGMLLLLLRDAQDKTIRWFAFLLSVAVFGFSLLLPFSFPSRSSGFAWEETLPWLQVPQLGISHHMGVDGINLFLILLTTFLTPIAILSSFRSISRSIRSFYAVLLFLETGMLGVFLALDLVLFYVFWEVMLVPMYLLIGVWGGERRIYAAVKFILYTMVGSLLMLVGILYLHLHTGTGGFDFPKIALQLASGAAELTQGQEMWLFLAFFAAFAVKVPLFPLHTWLPDAHVEAPTAGSILLAGILLKMGVYGILRFCLPLFPVASTVFAPLISILAVVGILYGALVALVQTDIKKLIAYSSVSHLGFVVLGIFSFTLQGMQGAGYQMLNHGISTGALFLIVGILYERRHTRQIEDFGGLARSMPKYAAVTLIIALSSIGLPGLNGFVGEFLILLGVFAKNKTLAAIAVTGIFFSAAYMLWMYQRVYFGPLTSKENQNLADLDPREWVCLLPLILMIVWMGLYSQPFLQRMEGASQRILHPIRTFNLAENRLQEVARPSRSGPAFIERKPFKTARGSISQPFTGPSHKTKVQKVAGFSVGQAASLSNDSLSIDSVSFESQAESQAGTPAPHLAEPRRLSP